MTFYENLTLTLLEFLRKKKQTIKKVQKVCNEIFEFLRKKVAKSAKVPMIQFRNGQKIESCRSWPQYAGQTE